MRLLKLTRIDGDAREPVWIKYDAIEALIPVLGGTNVLLSCGVVYFVWESVADILKSAFAPDPTCTGYCN